MEHILWQPIYLTNSYYLLCATWSPSPQGYSTDQQGHCCPGSYLPNLPRVKKTGRKCTCPNASNRNN